MSTAVETTVLIKPDYVAEIAGGNMPHKILLEISWYSPDDPNWLNADNVKLCLENYCSRTEFTVKPLDGAGILEIVKGAGAAAGAEIVDWELPSAADIDDYLAQK